MQLPSEVTVSVESTNPPDVEILTPVDGSTFYAEQLIDISASIADLDDSLNDLSIVWNATGIGELDILPPGSDGIVTDQITLPEGPVTLTLEATDPSGKVDTDSVELTIRAPKFRSRVQITQPNTGEFSVGGSTVTFAGTMSDVDIDDNLLAVTWTSDKDGELSTGMADASGTYSFESSEMSLNTHQITMTVTDGWDYSARTPFNTPIGTPPSIILQQPYANTLINEGDEQVFSAIVSDTEQSGSELQVVWESDINGTLFVGAAESSGLSQFESDSLQFWYTYYYSHSHGFGWTLRDSTSQHGSQCDSDTTQCCDFPRSSDHHG